MHLFRWGRTAAVKKVSIKENTMTNSTNPSKMEKNSMTAKKKGFDDLYSDIAIGKSSEKSSFRETGDWMKIEKNFSKEKDLTKKNDEDSTVDRTLQKEEAKEPTKDEEDNVKEDKNFAKKDKNFFKDSTQKIKDSTKRNKSFNSAVKKVTTPQITSYVKKKEFAKGKVTRKKRNGKAEIEKARKKQSVLTDFFKRC